jgi:hypothetical protein
MPLKGEHLSQEDKDKRRLGNRRSLLVAGRDPHQIVALARKHTVSALLVLVKLMNGEGGKAKVMNKDGFLEEIDVQVPPQVRARCAEIVLERGYGKSPQAILVKDDTSIPGGIHAIPIMERIALIAQARSELGQTTDLEASELDEAIELDETPRLPAAPDDGTTRVEANCIKVVPVEANSIKVRPEDVI